MPKFTFKTLMALSLVAGLPGSAVTAHAILWNSNLERRTPAIVYTGELPPPEETLEAQGEVPPLDAGMDLMSVRTKPVFKAKPVPKPHPKPQPKPKPVPKPTPKPAPNNPVYVPPPSTPGQPTTRPS